MLPLLGFRSLYPMFALIKCFAASLYEFLGEGVKMLISIAEAAKILGVGRNTAYRLAKEGRLPCVRSFGPVRVHEEMLRKQIEDEAQRNLREPADKRTDGKLTSETEVFSTPVKLSRELDRLLSLKPARKEG